MATIDTARRQGNSADVGLVEWVLDSGSQVNVCGDLALFYNARVGEHALCFANGVTEATSVCSGVKLFVVNEHTQEQEERVLEEVYVAANGMDLFSLDYMQSKGGSRLQVAGDQSTCFLTKKTLKLKFGKKDGLYRMWVPRPALVCAGVTAQPANPTEAMQLMHQPFAHASMDVIKGMIGNKSVEGASRFKWAFRLRRKGGASAHLQALIRRLNVAHKEQAAMLHSDQGSDPEENAIVKRANETLMAKARALLAMTQLPDMLGGEALLHVVHTENVMTKKALTLKTPHQSRQRNEKLQPRMMTALFIGYSHGTEGYKTLDLVTGSVTSYRRENLRFEEAVNVDRAYAQRLLENAFLSSEHELQANIPMMHLRSVSVLQYDVKTAFLHGTLEEKVVMEQPQGFKQDGDKVVCRLIKSLYGLKQASHRGVRSAHCLAHVSSNVVALASSE
ncbi:hypothetical protein PybrP1_010050 [[Pythium] brassicae (nom. inval.)]|nr:hypothetical protein PybrP1_010050 [[Pythium] brassicae (nom. inval.)]